MDPIQDNTHSKPKPKPAKKPAKPGLIGPLYIWEMLRLARRGQDHRARFILAIALFLVLTAFSLIWFNRSSASDLFFGSSQTLSIQESATFGEWFSITFVLGQLGILCLLTPAYAAGGIAEEKDKRTLTFLLVSELTDREIIFGKFFGRTTFLLGILFAGLPILSITQLHGGVSTKFLIFSYLLTATTVILLSAVSAAAAAQAETFRGGLFRAYGMAVLIVVAGCGIPWINPFVVVLYIKQFELDNPTMFYWFGLGYPALQLGLTMLAVWVAIGAMRRLRARLTRKTPKPPQWVRERYRDEDREKAWQLEQKQRRDEQIALEKAERHRVAALHAEAVELTVQDSTEAPSQTEGQPQRLKARRVQVAQPLPAQPLAEVVSTNSPKPPKHTERKWDSDDRKKPAKGYRDASMHAAKNVTPKPKIDFTDPFFWKERYCTGQVKSEDDEAMKGLMVLTGSVLGLIIVFFFAIAIIAVIQGSESGKGIAKWLLLISGGTGMFAHLLQVGLSACGTICRERQRLTLESLLTIPVPRRDILWPKWLVCLTRGWWWGAPAAAVVAIAYLISDVPVAAVPASVLLAAAIPFATSYGLWLSIRCPSVNRALMWFLPMAGVLVLVPVMICNWMSEPAMGVWLILLSSLALLAIFGTWLFWFLSAKAFDQETILGAARKS